MDEDRCTCQGGEHQPDGARLRANDCPMHGEVDDEPGYKLDDPQDLMEAGSKVIEMADRLRVAHKVAPGAVARWSFELDGYRFQIHMTVTATDVA